jgi:hydroxylamine reductase (hybrid-cluster protein)
MDSWSVQMDGILLRLDNVMSNLVDKMADTHVARTMLDAKMAELAESQTHVEQRLKALMDIVQAKRKRKGSA